MRRSILVLACCAAVLAACSGGSSKKSARSTTTTTATRQSSTTSSTTAAPTTSTPTTTTRPASPAGVVACGNQMSAIVSAIGGASGAPRAGTYTVTNCRIASASAIWAAAVITPKAGSATPPTAVVLERIGATWNVEGMGSSGVGCDAPKTVQQQLQLSCPTEG